MEKKRVARTRRKPTRPEAGSLWDTLYNHQGISLFLQPICWTDQHTRLLGCRFSQRPSQTTPTPSSSQQSPRRSPRTSPTVVRIGRDLDTLMSTESPRNMISKSHALRDIMQTLFPHALSKSKTCAELDMWFGGRCYPEVVRCQVLWKHPDASMSFDSATTWASSRSASQLMASMNVNVASDTPMLAYVSRSNLSHIRKNCFRISSGPGRGPNEPVRRLQQLRSKNLLPGNADEDQYFVAVMVAMAQHSVYADGPKSKSISLRDVKLHLLTTSEEDEAFIVYTTTIPAALLNMFHEPHKAPLSDSQFNIEYTHVPIWPVLGLKERLGQVLGRDVVGNFDETNLEMFDSGELTPIPEAVSPKRRCEVLSEVLNVSFTEDHEPGRESGMGKRRRLEEGRVGVVR